MVIPWHASKAKSDVAVGMAVVGPILAIEAYFQGPTEATDARRVERPTKYSDAESPLFVAAGRVVE